jgi:8-oxo-dGTP pyrophosphatase MutT (NUDIX family)
MTSLFRSAFAEVISPFLRRPPQLQVAALCYRDGKDGREVMLITSSKGRWILPKGWPVDGLGAAEAAIQEAWEEGGVQKATTNPEAIGSYSSLKQFNSGATANCETSVYTARVFKLANDYPEADRRKRRWVSPQIAAEMVTDDGLRDILLEFSD